MQRYLDFFSSRLTGYWSSTTRLALVYPLILDLRAMYVRHSETSFTQTVQKNLYAATDRENINLM